MGPTFENIPTMTFSSAAPSNLSWEDGRSKLIDFATATIHKCRCKELTGTNINEWNRFSDGGLGSGETLRLLRCPENGRFTQKCTHERPSELLQRVLTVARRWADLVLVRWDSQPGKRDRVRGCVERGCESGRLYNFRIRTT